MRPHQYGEMSARMRGEDYLAPTSARAERIQYVRKDDLAAAFHRMLQRDLP